ncbi:hypothetical protein YC2023_024054 [Brassica napus]
MGTNLSGNISCGGNMTNVCTDLGDVVSFWHHRSLRYLLIALALLDFLGRAFVMVCGECQFVKGVMRTYFVERHIVSVLVAEDKCTDIANHFSYVGSE